jgi:hypothetical protein
VLGLFLVEVFCYTARTNHPRHPHSPRRGNSIIGVSRATLITPYHFRLLHRF